MSPKLKALRAYYLVSFAALGVYIPFFPRWLEARGIRGVAMGAIASMLPAMAIIGPPGFGLLADKLGLRGWVLRIACLGATLAFGLVALASSLGGRLAFLPLLATVGVFAFFRSPMVSMADVLALEQSSMAGASGTRPAASYGRIRLWGSAGFLLAAVAAGHFLDPRDAAPIPLAITAGLFAALLASLPLPAKLPPPTQPIAGALRELLGATDFRLFLLTVFLSQGAHSNYDLNFSLHLRDLGFDGDGVALAWSIGVLAEIALMAVSAPIFAASSPRRLLTVALGFAVVRWVLLAVVRDPAGVLLVAPLHAVSFGLMWLASLAYVKERSPPLTLATAQGLFAAAASCGSVTGMLCWGALYRQRGGAATFGAAAAVAACAFCVAMLFAQRASGPARAAGEAPATESAG